MPRSRSIALCVLVGAVFSVGCASRKAEAPATVVQPAPKAAAAPVNFSPTATPVTKAAKPAAAKKAPAGKPSAKATPKSKPVATRAPTTALKATALTTAPTTARPTAKANTAPLPAPSAPAGPVGMVMSLGAGDSLGRAVYINDVMIAARAAKGQSEFAEVQPKDND